MFPNHTLRAWWLRRSAPSAPRVMPLLTDRALRAVFQPLVDVRSGVIVGHEALARAPLARPELTIERLLQASHEEHCQRNFELACAEQAFESWMAQGARGQLFVNLSAATLIQLYVSDLGGLLLERMRQYAVPVRRVGLDLMDYNHLADLDVLVAALKPLRAAGVGVALDDFKPSDSGMQAWAKVLPSVVKLAPRWTRNLATESQQAKTVESLVRLTRKHDSLLLAKCIESEDALRAAARLGVNWVQGYFLGSPDNIPCSQLNVRARRVLSSVV